MVMDFNALIKENEKILEKLTEDGSKRLSKLFNQLFKIGYYKGVNDLLNNAPKPTRDELSILAAGLVRLIQDDHDSQEEKTKSSNTE